LAACFVDSPSGAENSTAQETTQSQTTTGPGTTTASEDAGTAPATADTTGSASSTSGSTTAPSTDTSESSPDTTATESSTGDDLPEWIAQCQAAGIVVTPDEPTSRDEWTVQFSHPVGLTDITLTVANGVVTVYTAERMCVGRPELNCWEFSPWGGLWPAGTLTLTVDADQIEPETCMMELL
jgi:hypothetical protein